MGKPRPGCFAMPPDSLVRMQTAREHGASVQDLARWFDRSPAWVRTTLHALQASASSSDVQASA